MKIHHFLSFVLVVFFLGLSGCTTTDSTKKSPPPATSSNQETPTPTPPPATTDTTASAPTAPVDDGTIKPLDQLPKGKGGFPYGIKTKWPGLVKSPYAQDKTLVDVGSMSSGTPVRCPHTGKIFIVP
jgi:hypothetical protein